ncbi:ATP-binding protein [Ornithinibacillus californiensis]|uniref:ATP-binding protein n=1 Tax=Ornithinibacillus californiensis TaxID=161536 RepID=UPI00064E075A|nr:AAA family ATPase [Ornithinibacillus californiensis]
MKILQATIYGFGKWVDYDIDFSKTSFITIYGENESGKTTLQNFIRFMLFGLPPKQRKFYQPKTSNKMGGQLTVHDHDVGTYTIERLSDTRNGGALCFTADGSEHDEVWLQERLHGIDEKTYQAIFSFSATDLNRIQDIKEEDVSEVLLGIGLTGSTRIHAIEKKLDQRISDYFKPYGKNPVINQQLTKLTQLHKQLTEMKREDASYREKKNTILSLEEGIDSVTQEIKEQKKKQYLLEKILQALPQVEEHSRHQNRLTELPDTISFPEKGIDRLEALKDRLYPLKSDLKGIENSKARYIQEQQVLTSKNNQFAIGEAVKLFTDHSRYQNQIQEQLNIQEQVNKLNEEITTKLNELNIGIQMKELLDLHLPFHLEKEWNDLKNEVEKQKTEMETNKENKHLQEAKQALIEQELQDIQVNLLSSDKRKELEEVLDSYKENKLLLALQKETVEKQAKWKKTKRQTNKRIGFVLGFSVVISILFGMLAFLSDNLILLNITVLSILIGAAQWVNGKKSIQNMEAMLTNTGESHAKTLITENDRNKAEELLLMDQELKREQDLLLDKLRDSDLQLNQLNEQKMLIEKRDRDIQQKISSHQNMYSFLANIDVIYWPELYLSLKTILQDVKRVGELKMLETEIQKHIENFKERVSAFFQKYDFENSPKTLQTRLERIELEIEAFRVREKQIEQISVMLRELDKELDERRIQFETVNKEISLLLDFANATDEEDFYQKSKQLTEKEDLIYRCEKIKEQFSSFFTVEEWDQLINQPPKLSSIEIELSELDKVVLELEESLESKRQRLAQITIEFQRLETSEMYSVTLHQFQMEQEKLMRQAREWAIQKTARELLTETKGNFRDKYLSKVLEQTTHFFQLLTENAYIHVYPPAEEKPFIVERKDRIRFTVQELSQGTINQLYVSLRLAISTVMSENLHMPFIIDDAFVHFDVERNDRVIQILEQIASRHQILFFTCRQDIISQISDKNLLRLTKVVPLVEN